MTDLANTVEKLTDENDHTGATIELAKAVGGILAGAYLVVLEEIKDRQELTGSIDQNDQKLRDAIQADLMTTARLRNLI